MAIGNKVRDGALPFLAGLRALDVESSGAGDFALEVLDGERRDLAHARHDARRDGEDRGAGPALATAAGASGRRPAHEC